MIVAPAISNVTFRRPYLSYEWGSRFSCPALIELRLDCQLHFRCSSLSSSSVVSNATWTDESSVYHACPSACCPSRIVESQQAILRLGYSFSWLTWRNRCSVLSPALPWLFPILASPFPAAITSHQPVASLGQPPLRSSFSAERTPVQPIRQPAQISNFPCCLEAQLFSIRWRGCFPCRGPSQLRPNACVLRC